MTEFRETLNDIFLEQQSTLEKLLSFLEKEPEKTLLNDLYYKGGEEAFHACVGTLKKHTTNRYLMNAIFNHVGVMYKSKKGDYEGALKLLFKVQQNIGEAMGAEVQIHITAKERAAARHANDPKQSEKKFVKDCWIKWNNNSLLYTSKAAFARDMLDKCEHLLSQKKIEDWCRSWERQEA